MNRTLYILRQQPDRISSSLFRSDDANIDVVLIEQAPMDPSVKGAVVGIQTVGGVLSGPKMTFDDLVEQVFSADHVIVV